MLSDWDHYQRVEHILQLWENWHWIQHRSTGEEHLSFLEGCCDRTSRCNSFYFFHPHVLVKNLKKKRSFFPPSIYNFQVCYGLLFFKDNQILTSRAFWVWWALQNFMSWVIMLILCWNTLISIHFICWQVSILAFSLFCCHSSWSISKWARARGSGPVVSAHILSIQGSYIISDALRLIAY